jgi:hypothetical protein
MRERRLIRDHAISGFLSPLIVVDGKRVTKGCGYNAATGLFIILLHDPQAQAFIEYIQNDVFAG